MPASLTVRIVDYPGEWLLDLPLLEQSYAEWSATTLPLFRKLVRAPDVVDGDYHINWLEQFLAREQE